MVTVSKHGHRGEAPAGVSAAAALALRHFYPRRVYPHGSGYEQVNPSDGGIPWGRTPAAKSAAAAFSLRLCMGRVFAGQGFAGGEILPPGRRTPANYGILW
jgi:hypothetical protein